MADVVRVLIGVFFYFLFSWYIAHLFFEMAKAKGWNDKKYFWLCFWLGIPGWILICAMPDRGNAVKEISDELPDL